MVDAYEGRVRICRRCIPYIDRLTESERGKAIERLQRTLTERSHMVTHRAMQIGQVVGGSIGGLASAGFNLGVGVSSGLYSSARVLGTPMRHFMSQRVQDIEDSQVRGNTSEVRVGDAEIIRELEQYNMMLRARQGSVEIPGEARDRSQTEDQGSYGASRRSRGSRVGRSDSRYLPQRWMEDVAEYRFTRMAQGSRFVSAVQSEISDTVPQPQVADEEAVNRGDEADGDVTLVANGHVTPVVNGGATPTAEGPSEERGQVEKPSRTAGGRGAGMNGSGPDADGDAGRNNRRCGGSREDNHNRRWLSDQGG